MPKLLSKTLQYKKIFFVVALAIIFAGILPIGVQIARADCNTSPLNIVSTCVCKDQKCEKVSYTSTEGWGDQCHTNDDCAGRADTGKGIIGKLASPLDTIGSAFMKVLVSLVFALPLFLWAFLSDLAGMVLQATLNFIMSTSITQTPGVQLGWPIVRNLANMIIVLGFVVIGIATALRIESYEAKKLLPKLIIVAILVNFSLLFCGIVIDGTNILMNFMWSEVNKIKDASGNVVGATLFRNTSNSWSAITSIANTDSSWIAFAAAMMSNILFSMIAFFIYLLYAVILLCRIVFLMMLSILAPLAFVCSVFPSTKSIWDMWKKNFIQWAIIGIPMGLFYYIAATTMNSMSHFLNMSDVITDTSLGGSGFSKELAGAVSMMVPGLFLIGGFMLSLQITPMGAGAIMNFASKNKGKAMMGGLGALGKANSKFLGAVGGGLSKGGDYLSQTKIGKYTGTGFLTKKIGQGIQAMGRTDLRASTLKAKAGLISAGEAIGAIKPGTGAQGRSEELDKSQKRMSALVARGELDRVLAAAAGKGAGTNPTEMAGAVGALMESGNFDFNNAQHIAGLNAYQDQGGSLSKYSGKDRRYAEFDKAAIRNTIIKEKARGNIITEDAAREMVADGAYASMGVKEIKESSQINMRVFKNVPHTRIAKACDEFSRKQITDYNKWATPGTAEHTQLIAEEARLRATGRPEDTEAANRIRDNIDEIATNPNFA